MQRCICATLASVMVNVTQEGSGQHVRALRMGRCQLLIHQRLVHGERRRDGDV